MKRLSIILMAALLATAADAKVTLPKMFGNGMVMQRESDANLWGSAKSNSIVKITTSWNNKKYSVKADANGKWKATVKTTEAGGPYTITFNDGEKTSLSNILLGDLWLCAGQSNMEMPMKGFKNQPVGNAVEDILHSTDSQLRLFTVKRNSQLHPVDTVSGSWYMANPASVREFSATAYHFGKELRRELNVPIGLIVASWGGSSCESWMTADMLAAFPEAKIPHKKEDIWSPNRTATVLYNGMLHPLIGMTIKGAIWYQGEDNVVRYKTYADMMSAMVNGWRNEWNQGAFPFYFCQIAPYDYSLIGWKELSPYLREQQSKAELMIPNCGMAVLMDAGLEFGIHPRKKQIAGMRLALLALDNTYKMEGLVSKSAYYKEMKIHNDTCEVFFNRADMWLSGEQGWKSDLVEIAGEDHVFHPAKAWIFHSRLYATSDKVKKPVALRYAFHDWAQGDLFCDGLPVSSFRTDNWDPADSNKKMTKDYNN